MVSKFGTEEIKAFIQDAKFDRSKVIVTETSIHIGGKKIARKENLICFAGLPKARKTTFVFGLIAACLTGRTIYEIQAKPGKVILLDTEQAQLEHLEQIERLEKLIGKRVDKLPFQSYVLRSFNLEQVKAMVEPILITEKPDYLVLDALTEMVYNFNDNEEVKHFIEWLKAITTKYKIVLVGVMHLGKLNNFTVGALGSAIDRVCQSLLMVTKDEETKTSILTAKFLRSDEHFEPIAIAFDELTGTMVQVESPGNYKINEKKTKWSDKTEQEHKNIVAIIFENEKELSYKALVNALTLYYGRGTTIVKTQIIAFLLSKKYILNINSNYTKGKL